MKTTKKSDKRGEKKTKKAEVKMKLQQMNGKQFFITLPNQIIRAKGWSKGDRLKVLIDGKGDLVIRKE